MNILRFFFFIGVLIIHCECTEKEVDGSFFVHNVSLCGNYSTDFIFNKLMELQDIQANHNAENIAKLLEINKSLTMLNNSIFERLDRILYELKEMEPNEKLRDLMRKTQDHMLEKIHQNLKEVKASDVRQSELVLESGSCKDSNAQLAQKLFLDRLNEMKEAIHKLNSQSERFNEMYTFMTSYRSCDEAMERNRHSGVFSIVPVRNNPLSFKAYCLRDHRKQHNNQGRAWTVIQRRQSNSSHFINFNRNWESYKNGFGNPSFDYWLGLDNIFSLLSTQRHELWVYIENEKGQRLNSFHDDFSIANEAEDYAIISLGKNTGSADMRNCSKVPFNTYDRGDTKYANANGGSGFWGPCKLNYNSQRISHNGKPYIDIVLFHKEVRYIHFAIRPKK